MSWTRELLVLLSFTINLNKENQVSSENHYSNIGRKAEKEVFSEENVSDIDIIVVFSDNELPNDSVDRINHEIKLMELTASSIDSIWMTEKEFKNAVKIKRDIILSGLYEGKILIDPENFS